MNGTDRRPIKVKMNVVDKHAYEDAESQRPARNHSNQVARKKTNRFLSHRDCSMHPSRISNLQTAVMHIKKACQTLCSLRGMEAVQFESSSPRLQ